MYGLSYSYTARAFVMIFFYYNLKSCPLLKQESITEKNSFDFFYNIIWKVYKYVSVLKVLQRKIVLIFS